MIIFINKDGEGVFIENGIDDWNFFVGEGFEVRKDGIVDKNLLEVAEWRVTPKLDMKKAFQPLKFYEIAWWEDMWQTPETPDGYSYCNVLESLKEIDYIAMHK